MDERALSVTQAAVAVPALSGISRVERNFWTGIVLLTAGIAAAYVYYTIFAIFQGYDDEGFVLISLKSFFQGKPLYDEVYSTFQPGFYALHWVIFKLSGVSLCHDNMRLLTLVFWLGAAFVNGLISLRLTTSRWVALLVTVLSVRSMEAFANEPGHPQAISYLLVSAVAAVLVFADSISSRRLGWIIGSFISLLVMIKINVGIFVLLPVTLLFASNFPGTKGRYLKLCVAVLMMALPIGLWRHQLSVDATSLIALVLAALVGLLIAAMGVSASRRLRYAAVLGFVACAAALSQLDTTSVSAPPLFSSALLTLSISTAIMLCLHSSPPLTFNDNTLLRALAACALIIACILIFVLFRGTTFRGLFAGLLLWPAKLSTSYLIRPRSNWLGSCLGLLGAAGCVLFLSRYRDYGSRWWFRAIVIAAKLGLGSAILAEFYSRRPGAWTLVPLQDDLPHFWMLPFAWLIIVPDIHPGSINPGRLALLLIAVMQPLIACPIAGTQLVPASMLMLVVGAICLSDGLRGMVAVSGMTLPVSLGSAGTLIAAVAILLCFSAEAWKRKQNYAALTPLNLPGAARIRLPEAQVRTYNRIVAELSRPQIQTFLTLPGLDSFYFWSRKDPPNGLNVSAWVVLLDDEAQERIWQAAQQADGLVVLRNRRLIRSWTRKPSVAQLPLVRHIEESFQTITNYGDYELMVKR